jgi:hypothetical protein
MLILGLPQCLLGALLLFTGQGALSRLVAGVLFLDVVLHRLPWRPREDRTAFGYWVEALTYTLPLTAVAIAWVVLDPAAHEAGPLAWFAAAPLVAGVIIRLSGVNLTALRSGDLAFLAGPLPLHRVTARGLAVIVSPLFEEVLFRGIPATLPRLRPSASCWAGQPSSPITTSGGVTIRPRCRRSGSSSSRRSSWVAWWSPPARSGPRSRRTSWPTFPIWS